MKLDKHFRKMARASKRLGIPAGRPEIDEDVVSYPTHKRGALRRSDAREPDLRPWRVQT
jgi:hypothetical protein